MCTKFTLPLLICLFTLKKLYAQENWPSSTWNQAENLSPVLNSNGVTGLSGLYWNESSQVLFAMQENGKMHVLQYDGNTFTQTATLSGFGNPEGITRTNQNLQELFTIDENAYEIRKYTCNSNFSLKVLSRSWNILLPPSEMPNTGNLGPEGICFVSDEFLISAGFISSKTGNPYQSQKGMGGLIFIANQTNGEVWVYDLNPNINDDFNFVGKYKTGRTESCELAFDPSSQLLYILHNVGANTLETTRLHATMQGSGEYKFDFENEYFIPNPSGNKNIEGFTLTPQCKESGTMTVWLCRDVESTEPVAEQQDCLRRFEPFLNTIPCSNAGINSGFQYAPLQYSNPIQDKLMISADFSIKNLKIINLTGQTIFTTNLQSNNIQIDASNWPEGFYFAIVATNDKLISLKILKTGNF
jgi:hypothetical protein